MTVSLFISTEKAILCTNGFQADGNRVCKELQANIRIYQYQFSDTMSTQSIAQLTSTILYGRRFFPYYTFNLIGGLDEEGRGAVYSFDPVGSFEREIYRAGGSGASLIQPFLDSRVGKKNDARTPYHDLSLEEALQIAKDAFTSAAERDIHTGDYVQIWIVTRDGIRTELFDLRKD